jgi:hypothetical protein
MSSTAVISAALLLVAVMASPGFSVDEPGAYLTETNGRTALKEPLIVREEQGGIAGITGTVWTIEPSGEWKVSKFRRNRDGTDQLTPVRSGKVSPAELEDLAKSLAQRNLSGLPEKAGRESKVNPHKVTIQFGKKMATLEGLPPRRVTSVAEHIRKSTHANETADAGVWDRFVHITEAVESRCMASKKSP